MCCIVIPVMIASMREPVDEFGKRLRELRQARRVPADQLSALVGVSETYVGKLEREARTVRSEVLEKIIRSLKLEARDAVELRRLASLRNVPLEIREAIGITADPDKNVIQALLGVKYNWPEQTSSPDVRSHSIRDLVDAMGWAVLRRDWENTFKGGSLLYDSIEWPATIRNLNLLPSPKASPLVVVPEEFVAQDAPSIARGVIPKSETESEYVFYGLASALRRATFADPDLTRNLFGMLDLWEFLQSGELGPRIGAHFRPLEIAGEGDVDDPVMEVEDFFLNVRASVVADAERRALAEALRRTASVTLSPNPTREEDLVWPPYFAPGVLDSFVLQTIARADPSQLRSEGDFGDIYDSAYLLESRLFRPSERSDDAADGDDLNIRAELYDGRLSEGTRQALMASPSLLTRHANVLDMAVYLRTLGHRGKTLRMFKLRQEHDRRISRGDYPQRG
jgi:transcriptional regulator with XRE-family HTH domain